MLMLICVHKSVYVCLRHHHPTSSVCFQKLLCRFTLFFMLIYLYARFDTHFFGGEEFLCTCKHFFVVQVAVHCHAGLGRTGVLIASYLVYTWRCRPQDAIHFVRSKRYVLCDSSLRIFFFFVSSSSRIAVVVCSLPTHTIKFAYAGEGKRGGQTILGKIF